MVHEHVWAASGLGPDDGVLCIPCPEQRLGRKLALEDFMPADPEKPQFLATPPHVAAPLAVQIRSADGLPFQDCVISYCCDQTEGEMTPSRLSRARSRWLAPSATGP
jgi:hypothetical protein